MRPIPIGLFMLSLFAGSVIGVALSFVGHWAGVW